MTENRAARRQRKEYLVLSGKRKGERTLVGVFSSRRKAILAISVEARRVVGGSQGAYVERDGNGFRLVRPGCEDLHYTVEVMIEDGDKKFLNNKIKV